MQQKIIPLSAADAQLLLSLPKQVYDAVLAVNKKRVFSGTLALHEVTNRNTIRYQFEDGNVAEAYPLLAQPDAPAEEGPARQLVSGSALVGVPVTLAVGLSPDGIGFLLQLQYENQPTQVLEQPILAADRAAVKKEMCIVALVFLIILSILLLIIRSFSTSAILIGWTPPAVIIGIGLLIMVVKYRRSAKSATHKIVITGVVTEKITAWAPAGKHSTQHTWYRIGTEAFESNNPSLADPGQKIQVAFTAGKDGLRGRLLSIG